MKRSLVAATAAALLLTGCATGDTGHLDPQISPDLMGPRSTQEPELGDADGGGVGDERDAAAEGTRTPAPGSSAAPSNDVEAAFAESSGTEPWFGEVSAVDVAGDEVLVTTTLTEAGDDAAAVCEAALEAAERAGVAEPTIEVRDTDGRTLSQRDATGAGGGCSG